MEKIIKDLRTNNYEVNISVDEWKKILMLPEIQSRPNILYALQKWFLTPNQSGSCKALADQYGKSANFFSVQNRMLGQIAVKYLQRFQLIGDYYKQSFWAVAWIEVRREKGLYIVQLRPQLTQAIQELKLWG